MEEDDGRKSKYPTPHPQFIKEHGDTVAALTRARARIKRLEERLYQLSVAQDRLRRAVNGGATDPYADESHPGHILLLMSWEHKADEDGLSWKDPIPDERGKPVFRTLSEALGLACRRMVDRVNFPSAMDTIMGEDEL